MSSANFKPNRTAAASRGFLATAWHSCKVCLAPVLHSSKTHQHSDLQLTVRMTLFGMVVKSDMLTVLTCEYENFTRFKVYRAYVTCHEKVYTFSLPPQCDGQQNRTNIIQNNVYYRTKHKHDTK